MLSILYLVLESLAVILPILFAVAWITILERKVLAATQRRVGPNSVGYYGILQPFSDALKLIIKETVIPSSSNKVLFYLAPVIAINVSLLGWAVIPLGQGLVISDFSMGVLYTLTLSSLGVYGILFAGWSANSKYAFLGAIIVLVFVTLINIYLFTFLFSIEYLYTLFLNIAVNSLNIIIKIWLTFLSYCSAIFLYSFTSNWATTFLSAILFVKFVSRARANHSANYSTHSANNRYNSVPLNPWFITGFADGEGSFYFSLSRTKETKIGWAVTIDFSLVATNNPANNAMFVEIQKFFGVGSIQLSKSETYITFTVKGLKNCLIIRDHFNNFQLLTYKLVHFHLWCAVIALMITKEHLTWEGLLQIVALKDHSPMGLSDLLKLAFPTLTQIKCPDYNPELKKINIHWLAGFINADGSFGLYLINNGTNNVTCKIRISITQHTRSLVVISAIKDFLGEGNVYTNSDSISIFKIASLNGVNNFIAKFNEANLLGAKALDYADFCKGISIINNKGHLTKEGVKIIAKIIAGMNSTRTNF